VQVRQRPAERRQGLQGVDGDPEAPGGRAEGVSRSGAAVHQTASPQASGAEGHVMLVGDAEAEPRTLGQSTALALDPRQRTRGVCVRGEGADQREVRIGGQLPDHGDVGCGEGAQPDPTPGGLGGRPPQAGFAHAFIIADAKSRCTCLPTVGISYPVLVPLLSAQDPLPGCPRRVVVAGTSGSGKTTLAARVSESLRIPQIEIDALFHGPGWTPRPTFEEDVRRFVAQSAWATEWQYGQVRPLLTARADLVVWLDLSRFRVMQQVVRRTVRRRLRRQLLWNGNVEPPLWTLFTDPEHIVRWAWSTHRQNAERVAALVDQRPDLAVVRLVDRAAVEAWVAGPLAEAAVRCDPLCRVDRLVKAVRQPVG
jgi:adenylate kinase family enzyme